MGASGSGKSTLLNVIGILDDYDSGEYRLQKANLLLLTEKCNYLSGLIDLSYSLNTTLSDLEDTHARQ